LASDRKRQLIKFAPVVSADSACFNILIVEDEKSIHHYKDPIEEEFVGAKVSLANNGEEAWSILLNTRPALIITDLVMPVASGYELLRRLRKHHPEMPVLVVSAYVDNERQIAERLGGLPPTFEFLPKPLTTASLFPAMRRLLDGHEKHDRVDRLAI
jgi:two-component system nitrogen regulation response regulator GlnG